jgi:hypothetical protein
MDPVEAMCVSAEPVVLTAQPSGGVFSGTGVTGSTFDPSVSGAGTFTIHYTYTVVEGCSNSDSTDVIVHDLPVVTINPVSPMYVSDPPALLSGSPIGGIFSGTGVTGNTFDPAVSGVGTFTITYTFTDENGCQNADSTDIIVESNLSNTLNLKVYLEGPFNETIMNTWLNSGAILPLNQPYNVAPWNYMGTENFTEVPNVNVVDWVMVELRDATDATSATPGTRISRQAALLLNDGSIVDIDGLSNLQMNNTINDQLFVIIWHRNHLAVMSAIPLVLSEGVYNYDFSTNENKAYGGLNGHKEVFPGIWGMIGGDANSDGTIGLTDKTSVWKTEAGKTGYKSGDFNLNSQVENTDKNDVWLPNESKTSQVPD